MSKNVTNLSGRKGLGDNLFERLVDAGTPKPSTHIKLAKDYLLGEAVTYGAASFYDLLSEKNVGKKVLICDGSACLCAGTQKDVRSALRNHFHPDEIGSITCLGRCYENRAFYMRGKNHSGTDIDNLDNILKDTNASGPDAYAVESRCEPPILTGTPPNIENLYGLLHESLQRAGAELLDEIKAAKLRGRGGAGFPTAFKWESAGNAPGEKKYIVCNADEGDPGAYIDRYLMEEQPHLVLFGMIIAGYIAGADEGILYIRAESPESIVSVKEAIEQTADQGYSGDTVCGSNFSFHFKVVVGAGAYICGEETALLRSLEGQRPEVSVRPPYPTTEGLFGKPTIVNNVETFSNIHHILSVGGDAYVTLGTPESTGPKLASLNGLFNRPGLYEVPMGTSLSVIVDDLGNGFREPVKALHIGGPLGGLVPMDRVGELTFDFESFKDAGFLLGHGSIIAIPSALPMIEYLEHLFEFCAVESCGKCFPCRIGSTRGQEMMRAAIDKRQPINRELLNDLLETMEVGSLCAHGGGIPLPIKNALHYFADEMQEYFG